MHTYTHTTHTEYKLFRYNALLHLQICIHTHILHTEYKLFRYNALLVVGVLGLPVLLKIGQGQSGG